MFFFYFQSDVGNNNYYDDDDDDDDRFLYYYYRNSLNCIDVDDEDGYYYCNFTDDDDDEDYIDYNDTFNLGNVYRPTIKEAEQGYFSNELPDPSPEARQRMEAIIEQRRADAINQARYERQEKRQSRWEQLERCRL
jgi:hypothetical protein